MIAYYDTDRSVVERWDGEQWVEVDSVYDLLWDFPLFASGNAHSDDPALSPDAARWTPEDDA